MDTSVKLGLSLPTPVDAFSTGDVRANFEKIDAAPGTHICTSTTRPTWTSAKAGRKIYETNTGLEWVWTGTAWKRVAPSGLLKRSDGTWAIAERTTNVATTSHDFVIALGLTNVVVPDGLRPIRIEAEWHATHDAQNHFPLALFRSNTANSGPKMKEWFVGVEDPGYAQGDGGSNFFIQRDGLAAGVYNFSLQFRCYELPGGQAIVGADADGPIRITVSEM